MSDGETRLCTEKERQKKTPSPLLLIKRSGTPPSLPILGVALRSAAQKSAALVHIGLGAISGSA